MKRLMVVLGTLIVALYLASLPALAQGRRGSSSVGGSHTPSGHNASSPATDSTTTVPKPLSTNPHLAPKLTNALIKSGALPQGSTSDTLKADCMGFRNLGQCIAALHVAHNLGGNCTFTNLKSGLTGSPSETLGKAIQGCSPHADPKVEASKGIKQANADIKSAKS